MIFFSIQHHQMPKKLVLNYYSCTAHAFKYTKNRTSGDYYTSTIKEV